MLAGVAISHSSKFQPIVALFTCKAEYVVMCKADKEAVWLEFLLAELEFWKKSTSVTLYADNQRLITLAENPEFH